MDRVDDAGSDDAPLLVEKPVLFGPSVGIAVALFVVALGLHRWSGGDDRPISPWLASPLVLHVIVSTLGAIRRLVVRRHWNRLYRVLGIDPDEIGRTSIYRSPPDPRRSRRQRFIDLFTDEVDRSDASLPQTLPGRVAVAMLSLLDAALAVALPVLPLLAVAFDLSAGDLVCIGGWWAAICLRALRVRTRMRQRPDALVTTRR